MKKFLSFLALGAALSAGPVLAANCDAQAAEKKLAGAAKTSFLKKCNADDTAACEKSAADKKLAGAARNSHLKKCMEDRDSLGAACEKSAADKKLAGAAKASHTKKCMEDGLAAATPSAGAATAMPAAAPAASAKK